MRTQMDAVAASAEGSSPTGDDPRPLPPTTPRRARWTAAVSTFVVVGLAIFYISRLSAWDEIVATIDAVDGGWLAALGVLTVVNLVTYWLVMVAALPRLRPGRAALVQLPSTALSNLIPGGGALGTSFTFLVLRRWGFRTEAIVAMSIVTGLAGTAAKLAAPLAVLILVLPSEGNIDSLLIAVSAAGALALAVGGLVALLRSDRTLVRLARIASRIVGVASPRRNIAQGWEARASEFHQSLKDLLTERWLGIVVSTCLSHVALFVLFASSVRAVGLHHDGVGVVDALIVFAAARVVALVPLTPGGVGLVELMLTATLVAAGGEGDRVVAAVLVYRAATYALPTALGALILGGWVVTRRRGAPPRRVPFPPGPASVPLVVDLDGTLLPVTTRALMLGRLCVRKPAALRDYRRLRRTDRLSSKWFLWQCVGLDLGEVPVRRELWEWLEGERRRGRQLYVASGAPAPVVRAFVSGSPLFAEGWGSEVDALLVGSSKAAFLADRFPAGFDYVGDAREDLPVWVAAGRALMCAPSRSVIRRARRTLAEVHVLPRLPFTPARQTWLTFAAIGRQRHWKELRISPQHGVR